MLDAISLTDCSTVCCTIDWICANCGSVSNAEDNSAGGSVEFKFAFSAAWF